MAASNPSLTGALVSPVTAAGLYLDRNSPAAGVFTLPNGADLRTLAEVNFAGMTRLAFTVGLVSGTVDPATVLSVVVYNSRLAFPVYSAAWNASTTPFLTVALPAPLVGEIARLFIQTDAGQLGDATIRPALFASSF